MTEERTKVRKDKALETINRGNYSKPIKTSESKTTIQMMDRTKIKYHKTNTFANGVVKNYLTKVEKV